MFDRSQRETRDQVVEMCMERSERRLTEAIAAVRVQIAQTEGMLRREIAEMGAAIRQEMVQMGASIRQEMAQMGAGIREDMARMGADVRVDMIKWSFLFWVGQVVTMTGIISLMLRFYRP